MPILSLDDREDHLRFRVLVNGFVDGASSPHCVRHKIPLRAQRADMSFEIFDARERR